MKTSLDRRFGKFYIVKKKFDSLQVIEKEEASLQEHAKVQEKITTAREYYAASRIGALVRGFLDRLACKKLRRHNRAVSLIQRLMKGKLGRMRWQREYWRSVSVVKSDNALEEILNRSRLLREHVQASNRKMHWLEYFDPLTESFWYYNKATKQNTWQVPFCYQKSLICNWEGFAKFGGLSEPCRAVFNTVEEYQNHLRNQHKWFCNACFQRSPGILFPTCPVCQNKYSEDGMDGEKALKESIEKVQKKLTQFLSKDMNEKLHSGSYNVKDRLVDIARVRKVNLDHIESTRESGLMSRGSKLEKLAAINENYMQHKSDSYGYEKATVNNLLDNWIGSSSEAASKGKGLRVNTMSGLTPDSPAFQDNVSSHTVNASYNTVVLEVKRREEAEAGGIEGEKKRYLDPALKGLFDDKTFDLITSGHEDDLGSQVKLDLLDEDSDEEEEDQEDSNSIHSLIEKKPVKEKTAKLLVCQGYLDGTCKLTTCPLAHPGIRDQAKIHNKIKFNQDGSKKRLSFVSICPESRGLQHLCPKGLDCRHYHIYVRPSTQDIILSLYPILSGQKLKEYKSGVKLYGNVVNNVFQGFGTMIWPDGSVYMGDWYNGLRHGKGIFRSAKGVEYIGEFREGKRQGWGVLSAITGEEYLGQWRKGKIEGMGQLKCPNGDSYIGHFHNGHYEGIGYFKKSNGDTYMGYFQNNMAHGLGVLSLRSGEKYKGYFEFNTRHGQGICLYPNQCKYAGYWYRGAHQGFGIFLTPNNEKYMGEWAANQKHGKGRYIFNNFDFYDGDFFHNMAQGQGTYYHANGNIYVGQWHQNKRNGRGTYVFGNGSRYTGHWLDNNIHNKGRFDFANGAYYRGYFDHNTKHGKGIYTWATGAVYKGDFYEEKLHGYGEIQYMTGHRYIGQWQSNKKHGKGTMYYANGTIYEGMFEFDIRQGLGKLTLMPDTPVEETYEGSWDGDVWHGKGKNTYRKDEGMVYEGDWDRGVRQGRGLLSFKDGSYYRGEFKKDMMWGKGVYVGADSTQYDGEWRANMRQGYGTSIESDGSIYSGEFFGNMKQGHGKLIRSDGSVYEGEWDASVIIGGGTMTIQVGDKSKRDGLPKQVRKIAALLLLISLFLVSSSLGCLLRLN